MAAFAHVTLVTGGAEHGTGMNEFPHVTDDSGTANAEPPEPTMTWHGPARSSVHPLTVSVSVQSEPVETGWVDEHASGTAASISRASIGRTAPSTCAS